MLRRKPTAITLTTEDVATYEDNRAREAARKEALEHQNQNRDPNDELRPKPGERKVKTREERMGLGIQGSSRG